MGGVAGCEFEVVQRDTRNQQSDAVASASNAFSAKKIFT